MADCSEWQKRLADCERKLTSENLSSSADIPHLKHLARAWLRKLGLEEVKTNFFFKTNLFEKSF